MNEFDDPQAILTESIDEDGARLIPLDDPGPVIRAHLDSGLAFVPLAKPCGCKRPCACCASHGWKPHARRDFILRRAFVILAAGYDMPAHKACEVISKEARAVVNAMRKRAPRILPIDPPSAVTILGLWTKRPHKERSPSKIDLWKERIPIVAGRPIVFALLADLDKRDLAVRKLRTGSARFLRTIINSE